MTLLFDVILMAMAVYILVGGISGKGKLLKADNIKEGKEEEFKKYSRITYIVLGCTMLLHSLITTVQNLVYVYDPEAKSFVATKPSGLTDAISYELFRAFGIAFFVLTIAALVVLIVLMRKYTDPEKMKQNAGAAQNERQKGHILPVDAFDFDEDETATDEPGKKEAAEEEKKHLDDWEKTEG